MASNNGHLKVLLIEDNKDDEIMIRRTLEKKGGFRPSLRRVETEAEMILALEESSWDLILCDYLLPHFTAVKALEMVRERLFDVPFIMLSGFEDEETAVEMLKLGANDFIYKRNYSRLVLAIRREIMQAGERMRGKLEIEKSYRLTVEAWGIALEQRDHHTKDHTIRVTDLSLRLARALRVSGSQFRSIHYGSLLHDIGKMGIPDAILLKPDTLTPEEFAIMKMHPRIAFDMLSHIEFLRSSINIPYCHHEKYNGLGYPRGGGDEKTPLKDRMIGDRIPFEARLFSIVDVFDALTHDRPYRKSWEKETALEYLTSEKGKSFDPEIVEKFIEVMK